MWTVFSSWHTSFLCSAVLRGARKCIWGSFACSAKLSEYLLCVRPYFLPWGFTTYKKRWEKNTTSSNMRESASYERGRGKIGHWWGLLYIFTLESLGFHVWMPRKWWNGLWAWWSGLKRLGEDYYRQDKEWNGCGSVLWTQNLPSARRQERNIERSRFPFLTMSWISFLRRASPNFEIPFGNKPC